MIETLDPTSYENFKHRGYHLNTFCKEILGHATNNFQAPEPSGSEEDLNIVLCIFMVQTPDPLAWGNFRPGDHHLNKLDKGATMPVYMLNFKYLSQVIPK